MKKEIDADHLCTAHIGKDYTRIEATKVDWLFTAFEMEKARRRGKSVKRNNKDFLKPKGNIPSPYK